MSQGHDSHNLSRVQQFFWRDVKRRNEKMNLEEIKEFLEILFKWSLYGTVSTGTALILMKIIIALFKKKIIFALEILFSQEGK